jgi:hypothetical protein
MGILDEAIREHLDLKRRQGAREDELQRLEDEAFGPPSRPGDPDFPESSEHSELATGEQEQAEPQAAAAAEEAPADAALEPASEEPAASEDLELDLELDDEGEEIERVGDLEVEEAEPEGSSGGETPPIESLDTVEHHFEDAIDEAEVVSDEAEAERGTDRSEAEASEEDAEDVLEETPEFLQDTPEDDELWFEQGEPKDFDF